VPTVPALSSYGCTLGSTSGLPVSLKHVSPRSTLTAARAGLWKRPIAGKA